VKRLALVVVSVRVGVQVGMQVGVQVWELRSAWSEVLSAVMS
jgi:hypothetical protein